MLALVAACGCRCWPSLEQRLLKQWTSGQIRRLGTGTHFGHCKMVNAGCAGAESVSQPAEIEQVARLDCGAGRRVTAVALSPCAGWLAASSAPMDGNGGGELRIWQASPTAGGPLRSELHLCSVCCCIPAHIALQFLCRIDVTLRSTVTLVLGPGCITVAHSGCSVTHRRFDEAVRLPLPAAAAALAFLPQGGVLPPLLATAGGDTGPQLWCRVRLGC